MSSELIVVIILTALIFAVVFTISFVFNKGTSLKIILLSLLSTWVVISILAVSVTFLSFREPVIEVGYITEVRITVDNAYISTGDSSSVKLSKNSVIPNVGDLVEVYINRLKNEAIRLTIIKPKGGLR